MWPSDRHSTNSTIGYVTLCPSLYQLYHWLCDPLSLTLPTLPLAGWPAVRNCTNSTIGWILMFSDHNVYFLRQDLLMLYCCREFQVISCCSWKTPSVCLQNIFQISFCQARKYVLTIVRKSMKNRLPISFLLVACLCITHRSGHTRVPL